MGDTLTVKILKIEEGKKPNQKKIALSVKQASGDPWETVEGQFSVGQKISGKVRRLMGFGLSWKSPRASKGWCTSAK